MRPAHPWPRILRSRRRTPCTTSSVSCLPPAATGKTWVLCRVYISDIALWDEVNAVYAAFFGSHKPARVVVPTRALHHGALVEIEAVAELKN